MAGEGEGEDEGEGEGGGGLMAAAVGEEVYTEESRGEGGRHWLKETSYTLQCDIEKEEREERQLFNYYNYFFFLNQVSKQ